MPPFAFLLTTPRGFLAITTGPLARVVMWPLFQAVGR